MTSIRTVAVPFPPHVSHYTSVQRRIQSFSPTNDNSTSATSATSQPKQEFTDNPVGVVISAAIGNEEASERVSPIAVQSRVTADRFLSPIALIPADDQRLGPQASSHRFPCSDKGFLSLSKGEQIKGGRTHGLRNSRFFD